MDDQKEMPTLHGKKDRFDSILNNTPGLFSFDAHGISPEQKSYAYSRYSNRELGAGAVRANKAHIDRLATKYHLDPRLLRAIIYMENAHGWYDEYFPWNKTYRPGNINPDLWGALVPYSRDQLRNDPAKNLELTAKFLSRLQNRLPNRSVESVATLYNGTQKDRVTGYGMTVRKYYDDMPWKPAKRPALGFQGSPEAMPSQRLSLGLARPGGVAVDPSRAQERFFWRQRPSRANASDGEYRKSQKNASNAKPGRQRPGGLLYHHFG